MTAPVSMPAGHEILAADLDAYENLTGAWSTYTPTWTGSVSNPAIGNGTLNGYFIRVGNLGMVQINLVFGSTSTVGSGNYAWSLPAGWTITSNVRPIAWCLMRDQSAATHSIGMAMSTGSADTTINLVRYHAGNVVTNALPFPWAAGDFIAISGRMELA